MSNKETIELILKTSGFTIEKFELVRSGSMVGYDFEAHINGKFEFQVATDSFESAICDTLDGIYNTVGVQFFPVLNIKTKDNE